MPGKVDVLGGAGAVLEPEFECEPSFEHPGVRFHGDESGQKPVEGNPLAIARDACGITWGALFEAVFERSAEGCGTGVFHAPTCPEARVVSSIRRRVRLHLLAAASRSRRGVVRPRSRASRMPISI